MPIPKIVYIIFVVSFAYFIVVALYYIFLAVIGSIEGKKRALQSESEDYSLFYFSSLKLPVSIILPARNEEGWIEDSLKALLNVNYPKFEIVIVNDGSTDGTLGILNKILDFRPVDAMYIKHYKDGRVRGLLKSAKYPFVTVIDKDAGHKKAGAINAGLNLVKYDYVCVIDADTIIERDALLKVMAQIEREPDKVIGVSSYFGLVNGFKIKDGCIMERSFSYNPLIAYQNIEYIRSFIGSRIAWSRYNAMPNVAGGFGVWRKDVLYELGGFDRNFTCEDIELTFRAHEYMVKNKEKGYKIVMLPYYVSWTEGPENAPALIMQRNRWQRVLNETVWRYKHMICNPRYGFFGFLVMPYYVIYEIFGIFIEIFSLAVVGAAWALGALDLKIFLAYFLFMLLSQAFASLLSILAFVESQRLFKIKYIAYMTGLLLVEFFCYRWIIIISKVLGTIGSLRGVRSFDQYDRAKRV